MSFVNKLLGIRGKSGGSGSDEPGSSDVVDDFDYSTINNCPYCHQGLQGMGCVSCDVEFVLEDSRLVERGPSQRAQRRCTWCDTPMTGGTEFTAAWEDGDNANAYVTCSSCKSQNDF
ncbi:hypothetical protein [Rhodococcoides fascians]|uniref:hypothetical protein n=1 Tax=Rhodococcoides fascians TaxID=1828 RepID=UPI00050C43F2|nr:hypothetical protein [Rhodococcus fascians]